MNFLNITGNEGKTTVLEEIIKAVIILKTAFMVLLQSLKIKYKVYNPSCS
ncbi:hypothetical protein LLT7_13550 [Lactococcus cremoris subsp. cremoris TIFN7]|nr:hypothetical protein LLT7_03590 [Lactococcus cremoris subsp. cremoris TIFN7]EQC88644.1 hypothetical protein LLT7_13550 [Lactococcus cremoris subsp. cremoris TIFN7]